ncbi:pyridoxamine 5'-phosphate oxidase-related, FMN-binding protein [Lachnospiraceae bacterium TWA4]|nr:pyridoxamine 5'-phosphate oxidase-related, FMN-binding protein [Lachnospiraceae bacterium TWA4]
MNELLSFLKSCGTFYLATVEGDQPRVRPFGAVCEFEGKLYIVTNNQKNVYKQMLENGKVEISGMSKGKWIRVTGVAKHDDRREARVAMMDANKAALSKMYTVDDNLMEVLYLEDVTATIYSFTEEPKVITL